MLPKICKVTRSHSTLTDDAERIVKVCEKSGMVTKVSAGVIKVVSGSRRVKFHDVPAGLKLTVHSKRTVQTLYIFTANPEGIKKLIEQLYVGAN